MMAVLGVLKGALLFLLLFIVVVQADPKACEANVLALAEKNPEYLALMIDASGKAVDDLGKWDECRDLGKDVAHYCTTRFFLNVSIPTPYISFCLPINCTAADIGDIALAYLNKKVQNNTNMIEVIVIEKMLAEYAKLKHDQNASGLYMADCPADTPSVFSSPGAIAVIVFSIIIAVLVVLGTLLDGFDSDWWPEDDTTVGPTNMGGIQDSAEVQPLLHKASHRPRSKLFEFMVAFSLAKNFKSLVGPSPPSLSFLNGMRAISITWVILGHSLDYMNYAGVLNFAHVITKDVQHAAAQVFPGAEFSVDSFFWLSGFLVTYLTVKELRTKKRVNWVLYYFHRVWRLSPAYFYALFFYMCVSVYMSDGPMWPRYMENVENTCGKYWWTNLLYINNFVPHTWQSQCFLWGWYLAVDMQLYIFAPIVFLLYHKNKIAGWVLLAACLVATIVANGVIAHDHKLVWNNQDPHVYMSLVYGKPYTRAAPWLLGIACAFLYLEQKQMQRGVVYVGWAISATIMLLCVYGPANQFKGGSGTSAPINTWGHGSKSFAYFTFAKLGWSLALSFIMYSMAMGWGGFIRRFLGAAMWNPLARLTYSAYLFHPIIMFVVYYSHLQYFSYDPFFIAIIFVGIMFLSFCTAAVMFLALERPMTNMEKLFLPHKK